MKRGMPLRGYVPKIKKVQQSVQSTGLLYVGDCKMSALATTREYIAQSGNTYLSPLSEVQVPKAELSELLAPVWRGERELTQVAAPQLPAEDCDTPSESISEGFSVLKSPSLQTEATPSTWQEHWWVVHSLHKRAYGDQPARTLTTTTESQTGDPTTDGRAAVVYISSHHPNPHGNRWGNSTLPIPFI
jgi:hypothetical protein